MVVINASSYLSVRVRGAESCHMDYIMAYLAPKGSLWVKQLVGGEASKASIA